MKSYRGRLEQCDKSMPSKATETSI